MTFTALALVITEKMRGKKCDNALIQTRYTIPGHPLRVAVTYTLATFTTNEHRRLTLVFITRYINTKMLFLYLFLIHLPIGFSTLSVGSWAPERPFDLHAQYVLKRCWAILVIISHKTRFSRHQLHTIIFSDQVFCFWHSPHFMMIFLQYTYVT